MKRIFLCAVLSLMALASCHNEKKDTELRASKEEREALLEKLREVFVANGADPDKVSVLETMTKEEVNAVYSRLDEVAKFARATKEPISDEGETVVVENVTEEELKIIEKLIEENPTIDCAKFILKRRDSIAAKRVRDSLSTTYDRMPSLPRTGSYLPDMHTFVMSRSYKRFYGVINNLVTAVGRYSYQEGSNQLDFTSLNSHMTGVMLGKSYKHLDGYLKPRLKPFYGYSPTGQGYIYGVSFQGYGEFKVELLPDYVGPLYSELVNFHGHYMPGGYDSMTVE